MSKAKLLGFNGAAPMRPGC